MDKNKQSVFQSFYDDHDTLRGHLGVFKKILMVLQYPPELLHEVRAGWPEIQMRLRDLRKYFAFELGSHYEAEAGSLLNRLQPLVSPHEQILIEELLNEPQGIENFNKILLGHMDVWIESKLIPSSPEVQRFVGLGTELLIHLERHISVVEDRLLPAAAQLLSEKDLLAISKEIQIQQRIFREQA